MLQQFLFLFSPIRIKIKMSAVTEGVKKPYYDK